MARKKPAQVEEKKDENGKRQFRAWYTHELLEMSLERIQKLAKKFDIQLEDPNNPTQEELQEVYQDTFEEMSDPWEITANGKCKVEEIKDQPIEDGEEAE